MAALNPFLQANKNYANDIYKKVMVRAGDAQSSHLTLCRKQTRKAMMRHGTGGGYQ